ncbi:MAG: hypothetical protein Q8P63_01830, partial [Candidatus Nealsonbacteria bacterium]|nr:hypothetical protein [Candidatus Nealsonbacteria bacterium]
MSVKTETSHKFPVWIIIVAALLAAGFAGFMLANKGIGLPSLPSSEKTSSGGFPVYPKNDFPGIYKVKGSIINPEAMKGIITITHQVNAQPVSSVIKILADIKVKNVSG